MIVLVVCVWFVCKGKVLWLTLSAELKTTTSPGGWIHGSPSTWTGMSECEWILMWPPCGKKSQIGYPGFRKDKSLRLNPYLSYPNCLSQTRLDLTQMHDSRNAHHLEHTVPMVWRWELILLIRTPGIRTWSPATQIKANSIIQQSLIDYYFFFAFTILTLKYLE